MFRFYTPILILQAFCLYHAYKNGRSHTWFYLIIFLPLIGCILYLYDAFFTQNNLDTLTEGIKQTINSNRKIELLQKQLKVANTVNNRLLLADAYLEIGRNQDAIDLYHDCLQYEKDNPDIIKKLIQAHFLNQNYSAVIEYANQIKSANSFRNSEERIAYAWSLHYTNDNEKALAAFEDMNVRFANYKHRFEYAKYLNAIHQPQAAKSKLEELMEEYRDMPTHEKRFKRDVYRAARELHHQVK